MKSQRDKRATRHLRVRKKVAGTPEQPRLCVFRSNQHIYAQLVDDTTATTLAAAGTVEADLRSQLSNKGGTKGAAWAVGQAVAQRAQEKGITKIVFDRGGYLYHGRVASLAQGAREGGLQF